MSSNTDMWNSFEAHFQNVVDDLSSTKDVECGISWSFKRIDDILQYNVPFGKRTRGITVISCFDSILQGNVSPEKQKIALTLGWAVEILQASFLVADDLMDQSETRRGKVCWYRNEGVGFQAVNDCMILESCVFTLIRKHCRNMTCYADLLDLFHKVLLNTEMGQSLDMLTSERQDVDFTLFTEERYAAIIKYKTAYYSFYLPVAVALYLAGISDDGCHQSCCDILTKIGCLFQAQDDYLDCFGDPAVTGKVGTDIEDNKCSWLIVKAVKLASSEQLEILQSCYGKKDHLNVQHVKEIYKDLELPKKFSEYENEVYCQLCTEIDEFVDPRVPKSVFFTLLNKIYKRKK